MSRWMICAACATARASATCRAMPTMRGSGSPLRRQFPQRLALDQLHRDVAIGVDDARFVNGDDVRVIESGGERSLAQQPIECRLVVDCRPPDDLQRDVAAEPGVEGAIDLAHTARTEMQADFIRPERAARVAGSAGKGRPFSRERGMIAVPGPRDRTFSERQQRDVRFPC